MKRKISGIVLYMMLVATVFAVVIPTGASSTVEVDANGPYGTPEDPKCVGDPIAFHAEIIGDDASLYWFAWDIDDDGDFEIELGDSARGLPDFPYTFMEPFIGQCRVQAWDGSYIVIGGQTVRSVLEDTADVYVIECLPMCPLDMIEDIIDLIGTFGVDDFSKPNREKALINKFEAILNDLDPNDLDSICETIDKITNDVLPKTDGKSPPPEWVTDPVSQQTLEDAILDLIEVLMERAEALGGCGG